MVEFAKVILPVQPQQVKGMKEKRQNSNANPQATADNPAATRGPRTSAAAEDTSTVPADTATSAAATSAPVEDPTSAATTPTSSSSTTPPTSAATESSATTPTSRSTSTSAPADETTRRTSSVPADTTVTLVVTPSTVIVIGTSTITSALPASTIVSSGLPSSGAANSSSNSSSLSSGAKAGIIAGSVIGGLAALIALIMLCLVAKRRRNRREGKDGDAIRWPEIASSAEDRAALYPEQVHQTGRKGIGGDEMEEIGHGNRHGGLGGLGAGAAGLGAGAAGAYAGNGRWASQSSNADSRQLTLPTVPPSIYSSEEYGYNNGGAPPSAFTAPSAYGGYSNAPSSAQSHHYPGAAGAGGLAPGPASIEYQRAHQTPSPPRGPSSSGHEYTDSSLPPGAGNLPLPGTDLGHEEVEQQRPASPTDMQVGGAFGHGYDETEGGRRWRLSVVNDDPRDR